MRELSSQNETPRFESGGWDMGQAGEGPPRADRGFFTVGRDSILFDEARAVATISSGLPEKKACVDQADDEPDRVGDEDGNHGISGTEERRWKVE